MRLLHDSAAAARAGRPCGLTPIAMRIHAALHSPIHVAVQRAGRLLFARPITPWAALTLALAACGSQPPAPAGPATAARATPTVTSPSRGDGIEAFERQHRERAETAQRQGRLADAALSWEVLTALKPQRGEYRERLAATRAQIHAAVHDRTAKGAAAQKRGELDAAVQHYLAALALDPTHDGAADALRSIERERQKRHVGRLARDPLQRRPNGEADPRTPPAAPAPAPRGLARPATDKATKPAPAASNSR